MKNLFLIGGTMGVGKTTVSQKLKLELTDSVFLDGDWCWDADPFKVTDETKEMVVDNICYLLNNFIHCSEYKNIIFCWVMHEQSIIDDILKRLDTQNCCVKSISLIADEENLKNRLENDIKRGIRKEDVLERSICRIPLYLKLNTIKVDTSNKSVSQICEEIKKI